MTSPTQRYSAEEIAKLKVLAEKAIAARERVKGYIAPKPADVVAFESACSPDAIIRLLSAAAEDAARLERIRKWATSETYFLDLQITWAAALAHQKRHVLQILSARLDEPTNDDGAVLDSSPSPREEL